MRRAITRSLMLATAFWVGATAYAVAGIAMVLIIRKLQSGAVILPTHVTSVESRVHQPAL